MAEITLILGGAKSGKSTLALRLAEEKPPRRVFLATARALDQEMEQRIQRHQAERGPGWRVIEEPEDLAGALGLLNPEGDTVVLIDCLTLWFSNLLAGRGLDQEEIMTRVEDLAQAALACPVPVIMVSNEVGQGVVPENALARRFIDLAGTAHQRLARRAGRVFFVTAGLAQRLK